MYQQPLHAARFFARLCLCALMLLVAGPLCAQTIPSSADISRVKPEEKITIPQRSDQGGIKMPAREEAPVIPQAAKKFRLTLTSVTLSGVHAFAPEELAALYADKLNQEMTLDGVYQIAAAITDYYRQAGLIRARYTLGLLKDMWGSLKVQQIWINPMWCAWPSTVFWRSAP
jgi:hemolysin activation/secretion protein